MPRCDYTYNANVERRGIIESPGFPESYPHGLTCRFRFVGAAADRVRLRFTHFNLLYDDDDADNPFE